MKDFFSRAQNQPKNATTTTATIVENDDDKKDKTSKEADNLIEQLKQWVLHNNDNEIKNLTHTLLQHTSEETTLNDPNFYERFLIASNWNVPSTKLMLKQHLEWRVSIGFPSTLTESDVPKDVIQSNLFQILGKCDNGSTLILAHHANLHPESFTVETYGLYVTFVLEQALKLQNDAAITENNNEDNDDDDDNDGNNNNNNNNRKGAQKLTILFDLDGFEYNKHASSHALSLGRAMMSLTQQHYPERLYKLYAVHVPSIFHVFWNMVQFFMDEKTREKVLFAKKEEELRDLICPVDLLPQRLK